MSDKKLRKYSRYIAAASGAAHVSEIMNATRSVKTAAVTKRTDSEYRAPSRGRISNLSLWFTQGYNCRPDAEERRASDTFPRNPWIQGGAFSICERARCCNEPPSWFLVAFSHL